MNEIEPRTTLAKNKPAPPTEYLLDGRERRWCNGRKMDGTQCRKAPILGGTLCSKHGGRAPHIKRAAKARLENASELLVKQLLGMAADDSLPPAVKLAAIKDALDRAGMSPQQALHVTAELKPFEVLMEKVHRGPRTREVVPSEREDDIVDAEVVEEEGGDSGPPCAGCGNHFPAELPPHLDAYPEFCANCRAAGLDSKPTPRPTRSPHPPSSRTDAADVDYSAYDSNAEVVAEEARRRAGNPPVREATSEPISSAYGTARGHRDPGDGPGHAPSEHGYVTAEEGARQAAQANRKAGVYGRGKRRG